MAMYNIVIIGYGRFGELLAEILGAQFRISIVENDESRRQTALQNKHNLIQLTDIGQFDTVVFAVPISCIEQVIVEASQYILDEQLVMDICSVKVHPANVMNKYLSHAKLIATHPMFGPDSASKGLAGLQVAVCPLNAGKDLTNQVVTMWRHLGVEVVTTTPEQHDKDAVMSQSFTYSLAKILLGVDMSGVTLTTRSYQALSEVAKLSANDSEQLFHDMLYYNPYFAEMKAELQKSIENTSHILDSIEKEQKKSGIFDQ